MSGGPWAGQGGGAAPAHFPVGTEELLGSGMPRSWGDLGWLWLGDRGRSGGHRDSGTGTRGVRDAVPSCAFLGCVWPNPRCSLLEAIPKYPVLCGMLEFCHNE